MDGGMRGGERDEKEGERGRFFFFFLVVFGSDFLRYT